MKTCSRCKTEKLEAEFYRNRKTGKVLSQCRACMGKYVSARNRTLWRTSPAWREICYLRSALFKRRNGIIKNPRIPQSELEQRLASAKQGIVLPPFERPKAIKPTKIPKPPRVPKISPETKRRNWLIHEANQLRCEQRKQARKERDDFMRAWRKKWGFLTRKKSGASRKRRDEQIRHSKVVYDPALTRQIQIIHHGPCICFWCGNKLPQGGTVDHIVALAKGGSHTSDNVCAACQKCNSEKRELSPTEVGFIPVLF